MSEIFTHTVGEFQMDVNTTISRPDHVRIQIKHPKLEDTPFVVLDPCERRALGAALIDMDQRATRGEAREKQPLNAGDEVRLISENVWMTVVYADCTEAECAWFDGRALCKEIFPLAALVREPMPF